MVTFELEDIDAIKLNMKMSHERSMETSSGRLWKIMEIISKNLSWAEIKSYPERVDLVTKKQIIDVANRYFNENYLLVRSDKGDPEKIKLEKPPYKPVAPKNSEAKSKYAEKIESIKQSKIIPRYVDFDKDVKVSKIKKNVNFYYVQNPVNSIFSLNLQFGQGSIENGALSQSSDFISLIGTKNKSFDEYKNELQKIGSKIEVYSNQNYFGFSISGFDKYLTETLILLNEYMSEMHIREEDKNKLDKIIESSRINRERELNDPTISGRALRDYALYGNNSSYIRRPTIEEIKAMTPTFL